MNKCLDCSHNLYPGSESLAKEGYVGCDFRIKVEGSYESIPDGLETESGMISEGWVGMARYRVGSTGGRLINNQLLLNDCIKCGRYSKELDRK